MNQEHIGSNFDDFLRDEKLFEVAEAAAIKRVIAYQVAREMKKRKLSKSEMASRMKTSRAALERVLDPSNTSITLATLGRTAAALGKRLSVVLENPDPTTGTPKALTQRKGRTSRRSSTAQPQLVGQAVDRPKSKRSRA